MFSDTSGDLHTTRSQSPLGIELSQNRGRSQRRSLQYGMRIMRSAYRHWLQTELLPTMRQVSQVDSIVRYAITAWAIFCVIGVVIGAEQFYERIQHEREQIKWEKANRLYDRRVCKCGYVNYFDRGGEFHQSWPWKCEKCEGECR